MKMLYLLACIAGTALPYSQLIPWIAAHGLDVPALIAEAGSTRIGAFGWLDVLVSAIVLIGFVMAEGRRQGMRHLWAPVVGTLTVGVSLGLPLFLLLREHHLQQSTRPGG